MRKQIGAIFLVAGTCIGSGMIALPLVLAKLGIIPSVGLMLFICAISYYISIIGSELSLQAKSALPLGNLAKSYSGRVVQFISTVGFKFLTYALLAVYIYGGSSIIQKLLISNWFYKEYELSTIAIFVSFGAGVVLLLPVKLIDYINRIFFISLLSVIMILIFALASKINLSNLPLFHNDSFDLFSWSAAIPVIFTSFGFQIILHTLVNYCDQDARKLRKAFFYGILISASVYLIWTISSLSVVYDNDKEFYKQIASGEVEVGDLVKELSEISKSKSIQLLVWAVSLFAILTSLIGVGVGVNDSIKTIMPERISGVSRRLLSVLITIIPASLVAILVPNAFITVLGFAGMISAFIAIILPIYLFWIMKKKQTCETFYCREIRNRSLAVVLFCVGILIIVCEIINMIWRV